MKIFDLPLNRVSVCSRVRVTEMVTVRYEPVRGDLHRDDQITPADAAIALGLATSGAQNPAAEMNDDWRITSLNTLMILQAAAGNIEL